MTNPTTPETRLLDRREVFRGRILAVQVDHVRLPTGHEVPMEVVRHPGSVVLLPIPKAGEIILIRQYRYTLGRYIWELPAGSLKPGEDPDLAAARECEEEIELVPGRLERLGTFHPTPGFCDEAMTYYRCLDLRPRSADSTARRDDDEDIEPRTFTLEAVRAMIAAGEIVDLKTVAGLTFV